MENGNVQSCVVNLSLAIATADVLVLSIPYKAQASFIAGNAQSLRKRGNEKLASSGRALVLVDTSNGSEKYQETSITERLQYGLVTNDINTDGETAIVSVVKAFNTLSAYAIGQGASLKRCSDTTPVCSDSKYTKDAAISIGNTVGLRPFNIGALVCAIVTSALFCFFAVYCFIWYMVLDLPAFGYPAYDRSQPTIVVNKTLGNTALVLLAATYLPGKLAIFLQLYKRSARILFPSWLSSWLQIRKQLGLTAAFLVVLHIIFTAFILTGAYGFLVPFGNANVEQPDRTMNLLNELVLMLGIAVFVALVPVLLSSLPSISASMTWREWGCIQRTVGHTVFCYYRGFARGATSCLPTHAHILRTLLPPRLHKPPVATMLCPC
ncbi:hypothetical protein SARC_12622 [Sphaeroforma arctica JP610]|uniref:Ferric oxidoreductase domain-containing protein n=1 Tax=Sphaeroforma arctica JP610 TaxID=667725 RepID=A0A0L0FFL1_9EUKA|nr:hypothetical protein SARC_12622 [Sphaeroforma arctica JP610]KNC74838.1 hypothetical protein SARC_12622 [Sphaeroforma arctica JP610]|eukprot:XP_014148740.1 hypothetical protein SARC_12622 [Sphaeroforma arctica JP610]